MQIQTDRLILRPWNLNDVDEVVDGLNDFETAKNLIVPFPYTKKDAEDFITKHQLNTKTDFHFAITLKESGKIIGGTSLSVNEFGLYHGGIWLHRDYQNMGYGTETWVARAKFAFDYLNLNKLENGFFEFNNRSKNMQLKIGYKIVGEKLRYNPTLKTEVKEVITELKKEDFENFFNNNNFKVKILDF